MADIRLTLERTRDETPTIRSFRFVPEARFSWKPGQYLMMRLDVQDPRSPFRSFSIASSPTEGHVMIATRLVGGSPFKRALASLPEGTVLTAKAPLGKFTLHEDPSLRAVFVAGGIGITALRSMVRYATDAGLPMDLLILYSARTEAELAFREDLNAMAGKNERLRVVYTLTQADDRWSGPRGRIRGEVLAREVGGFDRTIFYVVGRPSFVTNLRTAIMERGVPRERVMSEQFPGYE